MKKPLLLPQQLDKGKGKLRVLYENGNIGHRMCLYKYTTCRHGLSFSTRRCACWINRLPVYSFESGSFLFSYVTSQAKRARTLLSTNAAGIDSTLSTLLQYICKVLQVNYLMIYSLPLKFCCLMQSCLNCLNCCSRT